MPLPHSQQCFAIARVNLREPGRCEVYKRHGGEPFEDLRARNEKIAGKFRSNGERRGDLRDLDNLEGMTLVGCIQRVRFAHGFLVFMGTLPTAANVVRLDRYEVFVAVATVPVKIVDVLSNRWRVEQDIVLMGFHRNITVEDVFH